MLHHASIEIEPAEIERATQFWVLLGFNLVEPPGALLGASVWLERAGTQIHLIAAKEPTVPQRGHLAVIPPDFGLAVAQLREHGFEVTDKRKLWGSPRALAIAPGGHRVELVATPPPDGGRREVLAS
jgi:hypothetical protein